MVDVKGVAARVLAALLIGTLMAVALGTAWLIYAGFWPL